MKNNEIEIVQHSNMNALEIFMVKVGSRVLHGHDDLEIGVLLKGDLNLKVGTEDIRLRENDIYILNSYQFHAFTKAEKENLLMVFQIPSDLYGRIETGLEHVWLKNNVIRSGAVHRDIRSKLISCAMVYFSDAPYKNVLCASQILDVIYTILTGTNISVTPSQTSVSMQINTGRLARITEYVSENYTEKISLKELAESEHLSEYYLSHWIKEMLGMSFQDYLNKFRFEKALRLINRGTNLGVLDIALECGFSGSKYLNNAFNKYLGMGVKKYMASDKSAKPSEAILPVENVQERYSFESSKLLLRNNYSDKH
ncbi:MAG: AraC family transcriptional regulator [Lachnospiraceae bacterium]|nr:AraC family transcriptional regulator [Lachnospiraceae bacterium]